MNKFSTRRNTLHMLCFGIVLSGMFFSCAKNDVTLSKPLLVIGQKVKSGNISGTIKGTMISDSVYNVTGDIFVNSGDTLLIQPGAKIYMQGNYAFWIKGNLLSLGTKAKPIFFTVNGVAKQDVVGQDPTTDPAFLGKWSGIQGDTSTKFMIIKYTHVEFAGGQVGTGQVFGVKNGSLTAPIRFTNQSGMLVVEDSWIYGEVDGGAQISVNRGQFHIMRNTFEKGGFSGGEGVELKNGSQGNIAYNLFVGPCTNAIKISNGNGLLPQVNAIVYNNTILNGGFRRFIYGGAGNSNGRGASIDLEGAGRGQVYNNLIVNSKYGLRVVKTFSYDGNNLTAADTANIRYSNNFNYGDAVELTNQFYPVNTVTKPQPSDIPLPSSFLPAGYTPGAVYDGTNLVGKNDPQFVNYPLPIVYGSSTVQSVLSTISFIGNYNFHLKPGSPCIGKGTVNFTISNAVSKVDPDYGATEITQPGIDIGCYQSAGSGLQH